MRYLALLAVPVALASCSDRSSPGGTGDDDNGDNGEVCDIEIEGIHVDFMLSEESDEARARASFWIGDSPGGTFLVLGSCDETIEVDGVDLVHHEGNPEYYEAAVQVAESYQFTFTRSGESPYASEVANLRPEVTISSPSGDTISRADPFDIEWADNDSGEIHLLIDGDCFWDYPDTLGDNISDNGIHTVPENGIEAINPGDDETCIAEVELYRETGGVLDPDLSGSIVGRSVGRSSFTSTP